MDNYQLLLLEMYDSVDDQAQDGKELEAILSELLLLG